MRLERYFVCLLIFVFSVSFAVSGCGKIGTGEKPSAGEELNDKGITPIKLGRGQVEFYQPPEEAGQEVSAAETAAPAEPAEQKPDEPQPQADVPSESITGGPISVPPTKMVEPETKPVSEAGELIIADFETWPNNLGGEAGVYGSLEPDWEKINQQPVSWVYEATSLNYTPENVHTGKSSFRLVNGVGIKPEYAWGSFSMDLGPATDITLVPKKVESLDASAYKYLTFWVKGANGGEKMELLVRDAHALNYSPQVKYGLPDAAAEWKKITVPLSEISGKVDIAKLDNIGIAFGKDVGNMTGDTIYIDDFTFTNNP